jgi:hypothetical protein
VSDRLIFLDIDGVLWTYRHAEWLTNHGKSRRVGLFPALDPACVQRFNRLVAETGALVVISSTWRKMRKLEVLYANLAEQGVQARFVGATPDLNASSRNAGDPIAFRGDEIAAWLATHQAPSSFAIIDDDADMGALLPRLVQTTIDDGLCDEHCVRVRALLLEQEAAA